jgi:hypothetical protein
VTITRADWQFGCNARHFGRAGEKEASTEAREQAGDAQVPSTTTTDSQISGYPKPKGTMKDGELAVIGDLYVNLAGTTKSSIRTRRARQAWPMRFGA